jgi:hypothetical protein
MKTAELGLNLTIQKITQKIAHLVGDICAENRSAAPADRRPPIGSSIFGDGLLTTEIDLCAK